MKFLIEVKGWKIFLVLIIVSILFTYADRLLLTEDLYFQSYGDQLSTDRIVQMFSSMQKRVWLIYVSPVTLILLRVLYTSIFIYIGVYFTELKISFKKIFKVVMLADYIYLISTAVRIARLYFFEEITTLSELGIQSFSVFNIVDQEAIDPMFYYPLQMANIFQLAFFFLLAYFLAPVLEKYNEQDISYMKSLRIVVLSYGSALLLWILLVMLLTLSS